jgi:hypothetical protein
MQTHVKARYVISCQKRNLETTSHSFEHHISGFKTRLLNYLRGLNDLVMIQTTSKPL